MWQRPRLRCSASSQIFFWSSKITHLVNRKFKHIGRSPRFSSSVPAATAAQFTSSSDDEQKPVAAPLSSLQVPFELDRSKVMGILKGLHREPNLALSFFRDAGFHGFRHDAATCSAIVRVLCGSGRTRSVSKGIL